MTSTIQSLCISIPGTLLRMTLKRRAEISADIFARLLRYFFLSCKNLTITSIYIHYMSTIYLLYVHYTFTLCSLYVQETAKLGTTTDHGKSTKVGLLLLLAVSSTYSLYVHYIFTIYLLHIYFISIICSLHVHYMFTACSLYVQETAKLKTAKGHGKHPKVGLLLF